MYQKCGANIDATCNCAVAIKSGDDVITFDRCRRVTSDHLTTNPYSAAAHASNFTRMTTQMHLRGELTVGTKVFEQADGKKHVVSLPHGVFVKVAVNADMLNVWVVASPKDLQRTRGLCGNNDKNAHNDLELREGRILMRPEVAKGERAQPLEFCRNWRVELGSGESILRGVSEEAAREERSVPARSNNPTSQTDFVGFCDCGQGRNYGRCGATADVATCDMLEGQ